MFSKVVIFYIPVSSVWEFFVSSGKFSMNRILTLAILTDAMCNLTVVLNCTFLVTDASYTSGYWPTVQILW